MLKTTIKESFKELLTNRYLTVLSGVIVLLAVGLCIYIAATVRPSELQLVTHYSAYGLTHLYRNQWWYLISFAVFGLLVAVIHVALAIKLYITKGHPLAIFVAWLGFGIIIFAWVIAASIINVWSPV
jgi:hypothetical protein